MQQDNFPKRSHSPTNNSSLLSTRMHRLRTPTLTQDNGVPPLYYILLSDPRLTTPSSQNPRPTSLKPTSKPGAFPDRCAQGDVGYRRDGNSVYAKSRVVFAAAVLVRIYTLAHHAYPSTQHPASSTKHQAPKSINVFSPITPQHEHKKPDKPPFKKKKRNRLDSHELPKQIQARAKIDAKSHSQSRATGTKNVMG